MVKFHFHMSEINGLPQMCCHVFSSESKDELVKWAQDAQIPLEWIQEKAGEMPHFDLWGSKMSLCGKGVSTKEYVKDARGWRGRKQQ